MRTIEDIRAEYPDDALVVRLSADRTYAQLIAHWEMSKTFSTVATAGWNADLGKYQVDVAEEVTAPDWERLALTYARYRRLIGIVRVLDGRENEDGGYSDIVFEV